MAAQMCSLMPTCPLPLDPASAEGAYELIKENSLPAAVKELLDSVDSFVGRQLADKQSTCFCSYHSDLVKSSENPKQLEDMWILQRDISVQLFKTMMAVMRSAGDLARRYRNAQGNASARGVSTLDDSDLELAFVGDARGGYQWLNCLARDECDWVWEAVNGDSQSLEGHCPACLLGRAIDSESTIRLLIAAARLLKWDFFVVSIQEHLASDPWWGPGYWETIEPKANLLGTQIRDLLEQCTDIRRKLRDINTRECGKLVRSPPSRRAASHGPLGSSVHQYSSSIPMKVDLRQLHELVDILTRQDSRDEQYISDAIRPYNHARMANNHKLAAYCWFVLMYNMSLATSNNLTPPHDPRISRVRMRTRTI